MTILVELAEGCFRTLAMMAPYLLLGFLLSGVLSVLIPVSWVKHHLAHRGRAAVVKSALFGVPLPLCSCGVLPVTSWIRGHGASKGATGAFMLATPQTGVDGFLVALSMLGLGFALFIPFAAFLSGVVVGLLLNRFPDPQSGHSSPTPVESPVRPFWLVRVFRHGFVTIAGDIAVPLLVGVLISGIVSVLVHTEQFPDIGSGFGAKLLVVAASIPLYVCATASIPIAASLLVAGLSPGTVFVFLMAGPATNAATFTTLSKLIGPREAAAYLFTAIGMALALGTLLDQFPWAVRASDHAMACHEHDLAPWRVLAAVVLLCVLAIGKYLRHRNHS